MNPVCTGEEAVVTRLSARHDSLFSIDQHESTQSTASFANIIAGCVRLLFVFPSLRGGCVVFFFFQLPWANARYSWWIMFKTMNPVAISCQGSATGVRVPLGVKFDLQKNDGWGEVWSQHGLDDSKMWTGLWKVMKEKHANCEGY